MISYVRIVVIGLLFVTCSAFAATERVKNTITTNDTTIELWTSASEPISCDAQSIKNSVASGIRKTTAEGQVHISYREAGTVLLDIRAERATIETAIQK